jgi:hypothetical protein
VRTDERGGHKVLESLMLAIRDDIRSVHVRLDRLEESNSEILRTVKQIESDLKGAQSSSLAPPYPVNSAAAVAAAAGASVQTRKSHTVERLFERIGQESLRRDSALRVSVLRA